MNTTVEWIERAWKWLFDTPINWCTPPNEELRWLINNKPEIEKPEEKPGSCKTCQHGIFYSGAMDYCCKIDKFDLCLSSLAKKRCDYMNNYYEPVEEKPEVPPEFNLADKRYTHEEFMQSYYNGFRDGKECAKKYSPEDHPLFKAGSVSKYPNVERLDNTLTLHYEFKPCPFCGGKAKLHDVLSDGEYYRISCGECKYNMDSLSRLMESALQDLSDRWNRRA